MYMFLSYMRLYLYTFHNPLCVHVATVTPLIVITDVHVSIATYRLVTYVCCMYLRLSYV